VLSRFLGIHTPINSTEGIKEFKTKAQQLLDKNSPAAYNQAIMEFGALHCRPKSPKCMFCPFQNECVAFQQGIQDELPVKLKKTKVKKRYFYYWVVLDSEENTIIQKRSGKGIWKGLHEFLLLDTEQPQEILKLEESLPGMDFPKESIKSIRLYNKTPIVHLLSHRKIFATFIEVKLNVSLSKANLTPQMKVIPVKDLQQLAVPVLIQNFIESEFTKA